jgi:quinol monooxygenase YgiN
MSYLVTARWTARDGEGERVLAAIRQMIEPSRAEPGCLFDQPSRDPDDQSVFFFCEIYEDESAWRAHGHSEHFKRHGLDEAIPLLLSRERQLFVTVD